jgi:hypothetical protein
MGLKVTASKIAAEQPLVAAQIQKSKPMLSIGFGSLLKFWPVGD